MGWLIGPLVTVLLTAVIGTAALLSVVTTRKPTGGALERLDNNTATPQDMNALQGAGQDFVRSAQILRAGGSLIGSRGPIPNIGGGAAGRIVGGAGVLGGAGVGATPTGAESALGGVVNRAIGSLATQASRPPQTRDNPSTRPAPAPSGAEPGTGRETPAATGRPPYDPTKDPGTGGGPPNIPGAMQSGQEFQGGAPWGSAQQPPIGPTQPGQPQPPSYTAPEPQPPGPSGTPPPYPGYACGSPGYPPCPPGYYPPVGPYGGEPPVQVPWQGLVPPPSEPGKPPSGGGSQCPPGCHVRPDGGGCHCPSQPCSPQ